MNICSIYHTLLWTAICHGMDQGPELSDIQSSRRMDLEMLLSVVLALRPGIGFQLKLKGFVLLIE